MHSALNQNLDAEIALLLSPGEKVADIKVNLASPDKFDQNGVPWNYFLSKLKFQIIEENNNRAVVKLTSGEVLKEPFLDFLLQVSWPKGDLYREFTILVDPPSEYDQVVVPVSKTARSYEARGQRKLSIPVVNKAPKSRPRITASIGGERYGPTGRNDTVWKIAEGISRDKGVSMEQLMVALYDANQGAFYKANMNALLAGKTLKIPRQEDILKLTKSDALEEFNRQMQAWENPSAVERMVAEPEREENPENQLTLSAPPQESAKGNTGLSSKNQEADVAPISQENSAVAPNSTKQDSSDEAIKAKIAALEKQLATMQELIELKDHQLATLQNNGQSKVQPEGQLPLSPPPIPEPAKPVPPTALADVPPAQPQPQPVPSQVATPNPESTVNKPEIKPQTPPPQPIVKKPIHRINTSPVVEEDSSLWSYLGFGLAGIALLGGLGWVWQSRRKNDYDDLFESTGAISRLKSQEPSFDFDQDDGNKSLESNEPDNLFVSDFSSGEFDVFDMDQAEIDPISEADVYLAYGRYQQAEDLMRHAIEEQPSRNEFKLKLLEIFYAHENKQAFEKYTTELIDEGKIDDTAFWAKVTEMGGEICPDSIFFAANKTPNEIAKSTVVMEAEADTVGSRASEAAQEEDFDLASFEELFFSEATENPAERLFDLDNDFITQAKRTLALDGQDELEKNNASLDFDLGDLSFDKLGAAEKEEITSPVNLEKSSEVHSKESDSQEEFETFNFDFDKPEAETITAEPTPTAILKNDGSDFGSLEFDFSSIETDIKSNDSIDSIDSIDFNDFTLSVTENANDAAPKENLFQEESLSVNLDFNKPTLGFTEQQRLDSFGVANLSDMDEMETKLDLAMAYIDMGDLEAAVEIAQEVYDKGDENQKVIAKALIENYQK